MELVFFGEGINKKCEIRYERKKKVKKKKKDLVPGMIFRVDSGRIY